MELVWILAGVLLLVGVGFVLSRVVIGNHARRAAAILPPVGADDLEQAAVALTAPFKAYGLLRLTATELLFVNGNTRDVLAVPRHSIAGCVASADVPTGTGMQTLRRKALVVQVNDPTLPSGLAFLVREPQVWVERIRG